MLMALPLVGCNTPDKANITLRKQIDTLQTDNDQLHRQHSADLATIHGLQSSATTVPVLPPEELDQLVTACGIRTGRLTGGWNPNPDAPSDSMLKVYAVATDVQGEDIKTTGTFHIE